MEKTLKLLVILAMTIRFGNTEKLYSIRTLDGEPGIYYEKMQDIRDTQADWKIVVFIDRNPLGFNSTTLTNILKNVKGMCDFYPNTCESLLTRMRRKYD